VTAERDVVATRQVILQGAARYYTGCTGSIAKIAHAKGIAASRPAAAHNRNGIASLRQGNIIAASQG